MTRVATLLALLLTSGGLAAQPALPPDGDNGGNSTDNTSTPPAGISREEVEAMLDEQRRGMEGWMQDEIDTAVKRRFEDFSPIRSRRELFIEFRAG